MGKAGPALAAAALAAVTATMLSGAADDLVASAPAPAVKGDRLDLRPPGADCSRHGWPYYENACLRDRSRNAGRARPVRVVTTDRLTDEVLIALPAWPNAIPALQASLTGSRTR